MNTQNVLSALNDCDDVTESLGKGNTSKFRIAEAHVLHLKLLAEGGP